MLFLFDVEVAQVEVQGPHKAAVAFRLVAEVNSNHVVEGDSKAVVAAVAMFVAAGVAISAAVVAAVAESFGDEVGEESLLDEVVLNPVAAGVVTPTGVVEAVLVAEGSPAQLLPLQQRNWWWKISLREFSAILQLQQCALCRFTLNCLF